MKFEDYLCSDSYNMLKSIENDDEIVEQLVLLFQKNNNKKIVKNKNFGK